eukprot:533589-Rhodomonas_salina.1
MPRQYQAEPRAAYKTPCSASTKRSYDRLTHSIILGSLVGTWSAALFCSVGASPVSKAIISPVAPYPSSVLGVPFAVLGVP